MQLGLIGGGALATGILLIWGALGYFRGTGIRHTLFGTPASGAGFGPAAVSLSLTLFATALPDSGARNLLTLTLLSVFFVGGAAGFVLLISKPLFGWPRYGQWPGLFRRSHAGGDRTRW
jgi:hypothetical protein